MCRILVYNKKAVPLSRIIKTISVYQKTNKLKMKKIYFLALSCAVLLGMASCSLDDTDNQLVLPGYFTITGSSPNYKLIHDNGSVIVCPSAEEVSEVTEKAGFGNHKRVYFDVYYYEEDVKTANGISTISNVDLKNGAYLTEDTPITQEEADKAGITAKDSIFEVSTMDNLWLAQGYLNTLFKANFSLTTNDQKEVVGIMPATKLCITNLADNAVTFTMYYNRHTKRDADYQPGSFCYSFDLTKLNIPGDKDSVAITFETKGAQTRTTKIPRTFFKKAQ